MGRRLGWLALIVSGLLLLGLVWFELSSEPKITGLRNIVHYRLVEWAGGAQVRTDEPPGSIAGTIRDDRGQPLAGAVALVASPLGHTYSAESGPAGGYTISGVPPGRYVPIAGKRGYDDAWRQTCLAGLCLKETVTVRPGRQAPGPDLTLHSLDPPAVVVDSSLVVSPTTVVEVGAPFPSQAHRTHLSFERAGLRVNDCWLYEPTEGQGPFPTMLLVLPGPVMNWEIIPVPFAAQGFSVLACYPLRGIDIDADAADLLSALAYLQQQKVPSRADPEKLILVGASFTSLHTYRLLALSDQFDVSLVLGGLADAFAFRHDVEMGLVNTRPPFGQVLMALGFPNTSPELYYRYSVVYHLEGLPPLCLLHGVDDELVPFAQGVQLDRALTERGMPHEFYAYEGLKHYFSTSADNATTQQMFQDALGCLRRALGSE